MSIGRLEDIESWRHARELTAMVYRVSSTGAFRKDFSLRDQTQRASVSIMANIAEGYARSGKIEFARFLCIARASSVELRSHFYIALDLGYLDENQFDDLSQRAQSIESLIAGLIRYLRGNRTVLNAEL